MEPGPASSGFRLAGIGAGLDGAGFGRSRLLRPGPDRREPSSGGGDGMGAETERSSMTVQRRQERQASTRENRTWGSMALTSSATTCSRA